MGLSKFPQEQKRIAKIRKLWRDVKTNAERTVVEDEPWDHTRDLEHDLDSLRRLGSDLEPEELERLERDEIAVHDNTKAEKDVSFEADVRNEIANARYSALVYRLLELKADDTALELIRSLPEKADQYMVFFETLNVLLSRRSFKRARDLIGGLPKEERLEHMISLYRASKNVNDEAAALEQMRCMMLDDVETTDALMKIWGVRRAPEQLGSIRDIAIHNQNVVARACLWRIIARQTGDPDDYRKSFECCKAIDLPVDKIRQAEYSLGAFATAIGLGLATRKAKCLDAFAYRTDPVEARAITCSLPSGWQEELKRLLHLVDIEW